MMSTNKVMVMLVSFLAVGVYFRLAHSCTLPKTNFTDLDFTRWSGVWQSVYTYLDGNTENYQCFVTINNDTSLNFSVYVVSEGEREVSIGGIQFVEPNQLNVTGIDGFSGTYTVLDTDYDHFSLLGGCPTALNESNQVWLEVRPGISKEDGKQYSRDAIQKLGFNVDNMHDDCKNESQRGQ